MAKGSKGKSKTEKPLITSKAFKGIENVIEKVVDKLPSNVTVDVTVLTQMACAGGAVYIFAEEAVDAIQSAALLFSSSEAQEAVLNNIVDNPLTRWTGFGLILWGLGYGDKELSQEEKDKLQAELDKIKEKQLTEEQKIGLALAAAALVPQVGDIVKGIGEIVPL